MKGRNDPWAPSHRPAEHSGTWRSPASLFLIAHGPEFFFPETYSCPHALRAFNVTWRNPRPLEASHGLSNPLFLHLVEQVLREVRGPAHVPRKWWPRSSHPPFHPELGTLLSCHLAPPSTCCEIKIPELSGPQFPSL